MAKKHIAHPQKQKEKEAVPKGRTEQKAVKAKEIEWGPAVYTGGPGPNKNNKFSVQEILWASFKAAMKDIPEDEAYEYRQTMLTAEDAEVTDTREERASPKPHQKAPNSPLHQRGQPREHLLPE